MAKKLGTKYQMNKTKDYFPNVEGRIKLKINLKQILAVILTGYAKTKAYIQRLIS